MVVHLWFVPWNAAGQQGVFVHTAQCVAEFVQNVAPKLFLGHFGPLKRAKVHGAVLGGDR